jgi:hypothetical protein
MKSLVRRDHTGLSYVLAFLIVASVISAVAGELYAGDCSDDCHEKCKNCSDCVNCVSSIDMIDGDARFIIQSDQNSSWIVLLSIAHYDDALLGGPDHPPRIFL